MDALQPLSFPANLERRDLNALGSTTDVSHSLVSLLCQFQTFTTQSNSRIVALAHRLLDSFSLHSSTSFISFNLSIVPYASCASRRTPQLLRKQAMRLVVLANH